jgi:hypothetical protein
MAMRLSPVVPQPLPRPLMKPLVELLAMLERAQDGLPDTDHRAYSEGAEVLEAAITELKNVLGL